MFALEALKAKHGDCLLLHWGKANDPHLALIDGGPAGVYKNFLKPRLQAIARERGGSLNFDLTMVSHIDDDHIKGILELAKDIEANKVSCRIRGLWHNSLEGLLDDELPSGSTASVTASVGAGFPGMKKKGWQQKVLASVPQGQELHAFMIRTGLADFLNEQFDPIGDTDKRLVLGSKGKASIDLPGELSLTIVAPMVAEVEELRKAWIKHRKEGVVTAGFDDDSPYNLSSIVVLAKFGKKRMLLTGDARGDLMLKGLEEQKLLKNGKIHVDLLKLPHHGSQNNVTEEFFEQVTADVYVVSGDHVKFPNPHDNAMGWLKAARGKDDYKIYCTYDLPHMRKLFGKKLEVPANGGSSITAALS